MGQTYFSSFSCSRANYTLSDQLIVAQTGENGHHLSTKRRSNKARKTLF